MPQLHPLAQAFLTGQAQREELNLKQRQMQEQEAARAADDAFRQEQAAAVDKRWQSEFGHRQKVSEAEEKLRKLQEQKILADMRDKVIGEIIGGKKKFNQYSPDQMSNAGVMEGFQMKEVNPDVYKDPEFGFTINKNEVGTPEDIGRANLAMQEPLLDKKFNQQRVLLDDRSTAQTALEEIRAKARAKIEADRQAAADRRNRETNSVRLTLGQLRSQRAAAQKDPNDRPLTLAEIRELPNANFGDTAGMHAGSRPVKPLSDSEQNKITVLKGIGSRIAEVEELVKANPKLFQEAHSKLGTGNAKAWIEGKLNNANPHVSRYREIIGELFSKESLETAGKALTKTELDRLLKWAVDLGNNPNQAKSRLGALKKNTVEMIDSVLTAPQHPKVGGDKPEEIMVEGKKFILNKTTGRYREAGQ
jgi:hypothetical protein